MLLGRGSILKLGIDEGQAMNILISDDMKGRITDLIEIARILAELRSSANNKMNSTEHYKIVQHLSIVNVLHKSKSPFIHAGL
mgnify:CR=1 FL=1